MNVNKQPIDIVIPWVDASDPEWRKEKNRYAALDGRPELIDDSDARFRDWDIIRFLLRGIDMYMPWVHKVHFVTCGHLPAWMNREAPRLNIVNHRDYIPSQYLPVFSSHPIELNMHRIPHLADQFIYFNDDIIVLRPVTPEQFFVNGLPRDYAILNALVSSHRYAAADIALMDIEIINDHFNKNQTLKKNLGKWLSPKYGKELFRTLCLLPWPKFSAILTKHQCNAFLKSEFEEVWSQEFDELDATCKHRFRTTRDVNQWLIRYWRLAKGAFVPIHPYGALYGIKNDNRALIDAINRSKYKFICMNDTTAEVLKDFETTRKELMRVLENRFPEKSSFEL